MGSTAQLAMRRMRQQAALAVVAQVAVLFGKSKGTQQVQNWTQRGLSRLREDVPEQKRMRDALIDRMKLLADIGTDVQKQADEMERCATDFMYWLSNYAFTYDPRLKQRMVPFVPYEFQKDMAEWLNETKRLETQGLIEKSRDMGATWVIVAWFVWHWLFEDQFAGLFCSRKATQVDAKGNPSSIMEKARIIIRGLPDFMVPKGYSEPKHALKMRILNPANGSVLEGEGGKEIGRGSRATMVLVDEAAFIPNPDNVEAALSNTTDIVFFLSTPNIPGDWFNQKRDQEGMRICTLHWKRDPRKNIWNAIDAAGQVIATGAGYHPDPASLGARRIIYPWYLGQQARFSDPAKLAREVDIDYSASSDNVVFPLVWVMSAVNLDLGTDWDTNECGADLSGEGVDLDVWSNRHGPRVTMIKEIRRANATLKARAFLNVTESVGAQVLHYDAGGGYGGALKGEYESGGKPWSFELHAVVNQAKATKAKFGDKSARELFSDYKTECHWRVRERFRKAHELALWRAGDPDGIPHDAEDCISIPNDQTLIRQLGTVLYEERSNGKLALESKKKLKERNVKSPDHVDSVVNCFAPRPSGLATQAQGTHTMRG